ncbi:MAG: AMP-binding protein [Gammaproteobacteria bacterium]|nr:AMP-binding protein [Gammaproteobacteria bacterium]
MTSRFGLVVDWLAYYAGRDGERLAAVDLASGRRYSYAQFNDRATRLATGLRDRHAVRKGDRVGLLARNSTDHFELMFACWKLGAIFMPLNWRLSPAELGGVLADSTPRLLFVDADFVPLAAGAAAPIVQRAGVAADCGYEALIRDHPPAVTMAGVDLDDPNTLLYTSGTTGEQKGVVGTHLNSMTNVLQSAAAGVVGSDTVCLTFAPLFHTAGLNSFAMPLFHFGGTLYVMQNWDAAAALGYLRDPALGITHTLGVPFHLATMAALPAFAEARFPALRLIGVGGAPANRKLIDTWAAKGIPLSQSYGMTEVFGLGFQPPAAARENPAAAGKALMYLEVQIGDEQGRELPLGERGEIQVRGPGVTPGYWNRPDLTAAAQVNGWFRTGDAGYMDPDRTMYVVDRVKDMFISGGENVYPIEVEHVISKVPGVAMVAVVGVPDERWGEVGRAFVVRAPGATVADDGVLAACRAALAGYKVPKSVAFVDALPISVQGKVLKRVLRAAALAGVQS